MIYFIGLAIVGVSAVIMVTYLMVSRKKLLKLNNKLDKEYGSEYE